MRYFKVHSGFNCTAFNSRLSVSVMALLLMSPAVVSAEDEKTSQPECGESEIRYIDDPSLSRGERLSRMEQAFFDSVNRFEDCKLSNQSGASGGSNNGAAGADGGGEGDDLSENSATASQDMQGTEAELEKPPDMVTGRELSDNQAGTIESPASAGNGAIPEYIPAANNDDAIAAQIRLAAESETDPEIREKLWNEYRKYKGLEVVE